MNISYSPFHFDSLILAANHVNTYENMAKRAQLQAEVKLVQLKSCLANLPPSLVDILLNAQTVGLEIPNRGYFAYLSTARSKCCRGASI